MKFERDICFFDIESTGLSFINDEIIELSILKLKTDGTEEIRCKRFKPSVIMKPDAIAIHKITNEDLANELPFSRFAKGIYEFIKDCDLCAYNGYKFDLPFLYTQLEKYGFILDYLSINVIDPQNVFMRKQKRDLPSAYLFYCGKEMDKDKHHGAEYDTQVLKEVLIAQLETYQIDPTINNLSEFANYSNYDDKIVDISGLFTLDKNNEMIFKNGKHKGESIYMRPDYLEYVSKANTFSNNTKIFASHFLEKIKEDKENKENG